MTMPAVFIYERELAFKFKRGRYKTYFVLGSNCVKLAEAIMGKAGMDIIDLNGIISQVLIKTI